MSHNPYFSRWFSAISKDGFKTGNKQVVTILILVDGFLQYVSLYMGQPTLKSHNPYFSRWFSAISLHY